MTIRPSLFLLPALGLLACGPAPETPRAEGGEASTPGPQAEGPATEASPTGGDAPVVTAGSQDPVPAKAASPAGQPEEPLREGAPADPDRPVGPGTGPAVGPTPKGGLSRTEFENGMVDRFRDLDSNGDGAVDEGEAGLAAGMLRGADQNGDGRVTEGEMRAVARQMFSRLDDNGDGLVTEDERPQR